MKFPKISYPQIIELLDQPVTTHHHFHQKAKIIRELNETINIFCDESI